MFTRFLDFYSKQGKKQILFLTSNKRKKQKKQDKETVNPAENCEKGVFHSQKHTVGLCVRKPNTSLFTQVCVRAWRGQRENFHAANRGSVSACCWSAWRLASVETHKTSRVLSDCVSIRVWARHPAKTQRHELRGSILPPLPPPPPPLSLHLKVNHSSDEANSLQLGNVL